MRYTRLKKAVENGAFKGALLAQGAGQLSPQLAAMANPESRRLASVPGSDKPAPRPARRGKNGTGPTPPKNTQLVFPEIDNEDEEEEETQSATQATNAGEQGRKRAASTALSEGDNDGLFYPDTSTATRQVKHIKREPSDEEAEESEDDNDDENDDATYTPSGGAQRQRGSRNTHTKPRVNNIQSSTASANDINGDSRNHVSIDSARAPTPQASTGSFEDFSRTAHMNYGAAYARKPGFEPVQRPPSRSNPVTSTPVTPTAPPTALPPGTFVVGIVSGQYPPTQDDYSFAATTGQQPVKYMRRAAQGGAQNQPSRHNGRYVQRPGPGMTSTQPSTSSPLAQDFVPHVPGTSYYTNSSPIDPRLSPSFNPAHLQFGAQPAQRLHSQSTGLSNVTSALSAPGVSTFDFRPPTLSPFADPGSSAQHVRARLSTGQHTVRGEAMSNQYRRSANPSPSPFPDPRSMQPNFRGQGPSPTPFRPVPTTVDVKSEGNQDQAASSAKDTIESRLEEAEVAQTPNTSVQGDNNAGGSAEAGSTILEGQEQETDAYAKGLSTGNEID